MLKPKKGFVQDQLNIERLTPIQWDGIMRAMDAYAEHYHEEQVKKLNISDVVERSEQLKAFLTWLEKEGGSPFIDKDALINDYLKSL